MQRLPSFMWIAIVLLIVGGVQQMYPSDQTVLIWCGVAAGILKIIEVSITTPAVSVEPLTDAAQARGAQPVTAAKIPNFVERVLYAG